MSGWGKADDKTSTGTITITAPTITFNGASAVDSNVITSSSHGFRNGDYVKYTDGGGTQIVGLTDTSSYYVTNVTTNTLQLADSYHKAMMNLPEPLTFTDGAGASHTLTLEFDKAHRASVAGGSTAFTTESAVGDVMVTGAQELLITEIASDTACTVIAFDRQTAPASASGANYTLNEKPTSLGADANTDNTLVFGVDNTEIVRGSDNIVSIAVGEEGTQYLEAPTITVAGPTARTIATTAVTTASDSITISDHNLTTGAKLTYADASGTAITGLSDGTTYFAIKVDNDTIKLATNLTNANAGTVITLSGTGNNSQTLTGVTATATAAVAGGVITGYTITEVGSDYLAPPAVTVPIPDRTIPTSGVTVGTDSIAYTAHGLTEAFEVKYQDGGGTALAGLVDNTSYFISHVGLAANTFRLATSSTLAAGTELGTVVIANTSGGFTCAAATLAVADRVVITGTFGGSGSINSYSTGTIYKVSAVTGTSPNVTGFTLTDESGGALTTVAGTPTGVTYKAGTIIDLTGTGNNAQTFEILATNTGVTQGTATASIGIGAAGDQGSSAAHSGWIRRKELTGNNAGRVQYEVLVALSKNGITSDADDDTQFSE
tara:strand:+ start:1338 stop:3155 length:1818 start_codon:yes stop_codon:yes gene_type:complete